MRDYEMVELKLLVAVEEGASARGIVVTDGEFRIERLMPGLYVLGIPTTQGNVPAVVLTDGFDLGLLGFSTGANDAALLIHDLDLDAMRAQGIEFAPGVCLKRESLPGWNFVPCHWSDTAALDRELRDMLPVYQPERIPEKLPLDM